MNDVDFLEELQAGWEQSYGFPMVLGAVDETLIPIKQPYINSQDYYSCKMKYAINVQVCAKDDSWTSTKWPGATHDAKVFAIVVVMMLK